MTRLPRTACVLALMLSFASPVFADGPLLVSAQREASLLLERSAAAQIAPTKRKNEGLMWAGIGMWAAGTTLTILSWSALKHEESGCLLLFGVFSCYSETSTNWPVWGVGAGLAGGGIAAWMIGGKRVPATVSTSGPRLYAEHTIRF